MTGVTMHVNLKHLSRERDRHGNERLYFRKHGKRIRIRAPLGTQAFLTAYRAAVAETENPAPTQRAVGAPPALGSFRWLVEAYYASPEFKRLDPRTQRVRRGILDDICVAKGSKPYAAMLPRHVRKLRDERAEKPEAANARVKAIRRVFAWGCEADHAETNPASSVAYLRSGSRGFHSWTVDEVRQYEARHPIGTKARMALDLLLYTGVRRSDVVLLGRQHARRGCHVFTPFKGRNGPEPQTLTLPILPALQHSIDATETGDLAYLNTEFGRPFTANGFGNRFRKWCDQAGLPHCSAHGVRKAGACRAAESGATAPQLKAVYGWKTSKEADRYIRAAEQTRLAKSGIRHLVEEQSAEVFVSPSSAISDGATNRKRKA